MVWIDHQQARIFHYDLEPDTDAVKVIRTAGGAVHLHHKANERAGSGHVPVDHAYLEQVAHALSDAGLILIAGPAGAKHELMTHITANHPEMVRHIAGVEPMDHPSDGEFVNFARGFFHKADRMAALGMKVPAG